MSVPSTINSEEYVGNGSTATPYPVPFLFFENSHLFVYLDDSSDPLIEGTDYAVSGAGDPNGGSITTSISYDSSHRLRINRIVPLTQLTTYTANGNFPAESHERALDKLTMLVQQLQRQLSRAIRLPDSREEIEKLASIAENVVIGTDEEGNPTALNAGALLALLEISGDLTVTTPAESIGSEEIKGADAAAIRAKLETPSNSEVMANALSNGKFAITYPAAITAGHKLPPNVYYKGGRYTSDFNARSLKPTPSTTYYVNPLTGSDSQAGTSKALAFKSLKKALQTVSGGDKQIIVAAGTYYYLDGAQGYDCAQGVSIVCDSGGVAEFKNSVYPRVWTQDATYPGLYSTPTNFNGENLKTLDDATTLRWSIDGYNGTVVGGDTGPLLVGSTPLDTLQGGTVGRSMGMTTCYVRLPFNLDPNKYLNIWYASTNFLIVDNSSNPCTIYMEGLVFNYGNITTVIIYTSNTASKFIAYRCGFQNARTGNCFQIFGCGLAVMDRCFSKDSWLDGFNYQNNQQNSGSYDFDVVEHECWSEGIIGRDTAGANEPSTVHNGTNIIRINCRYPGGQNYSIHDVGNGLSFNVGCDLRGSLARTHDVGCGLPVGGEITKMWLAGCNGNNGIVYANATLLIAQDSEIKTSDITAIGSVAAYTQA